MSAFTLGEYVHIKKRLVRIEIYRKNPLLDEALDLIGVKRPRRVQPDVWRLWMPSDWVKENLSKPGTGRAVACTLAPCETKRLPRFGYVMQRVSIQQGGYSFFHDGPAPWVHVGVTPAFKISWDINRLPVVASADMLEVFEARS